MSRNCGARSADERDTGELRARLELTAESSERLAAEAELLRAELERTRAQIADLNPVDTDIGRRWIWLVTAMIVVLGVLIALIGYTPR